MSKFNITIRQKGRGFHIGINVKHWKDVGKALKVAGTRVADLVSSGRFYPQPPKERIKSIARQMTDDDVVAMFGGEVLSDE